ncbi:MAG: ABC transporter ATP-binding protein [Clostridia bacterium]|nr:ABC transporter ATP-binding protein [Clostridia bacterium]
MNAVEIKGLSKIFRIRHREVVAVDGINLEVPAGSVLGLLGPNGAGKTTTLKMLLGLTRPTRGEVWVLGKNVLTEGARFKERIGYVAENPAFYPAMTAKHLAEFNRQLYPNWDQQAFLARASQLDLPLETPSAKLSKGQRAILALVLALAQRPDLLILDEPTAGFDPVARRQFLSILMEEVADRGCTVILSSHDIDEVERAAESVAIMVAGKIPVTKTIEELRASEKKVRVAFQSEPPAELLRHPCIRSIEQEGRRYVFTVSGELEDFLEKLATVPQFAMEVVDLNLEEIFLGYANAPRRSKESE